MSDNFMGEIRLFAQYNVPPGWVWCDGTILSVSDEPALFSVISNIYGGDGIRNFAVPNMIGAAPLHIGHQPGPGLSTYQLGQASGVEIVTLTDDQMPTHTHAPVASSLAGTLNAPGNTLQLATASQGNPVTGQIQGRIFSGGQVTAQMLGSLGRSGNRTRT